MNICGKYLIFFCLLCEAFAGENKETRDTKEENPIKENEEGNTVIEVANLNYNKHEIRA